MKIRAYVTNCGEHRFVILYKEIGQIVDYLHMLSKDEESAFEFGKQGKIRMLTRDTKGRINA